MRKTLVLSGLITVLSAMTGLVAAGRNCPLPSEAAATADSATRSAEPVRYPKGRWRLVDPVSLSNVVLWPAHILIRHESSDSSVTGGGPAWKLDAPPQRSRAEALALANDLATRATEAASTFTTLAAQYSDDVTTATRGGSLGGARASSFFTDPALLDALAAMPMDSISRVVETRHGFHILYKRSPPREERVSGNRIVIGHASALALARFIEKKPSRIRADALALARRVIAEAKAGADFQALVEKYSEHPDRAAGGDIGSWSTLDSTIHEREIETLASLKVGEVSEPVESRWGVEVLQRTAERAREEYSARVLRFDFVPADPMTMADAQAAANDAARVLAVEPQMFDELSRRQGSDDTRRWFEGREESALSAAVRSLAVGQVGTPVLLSRAIVIPQRVALGSPAARANTQYELPRPDGLALSLIAQVATPQHILEELRAVHRARAGAGWSSIQEGQLATLVDKATKDPELRADATFAKDLEALVGAPGAPYRRLLEARFGDKLMNAEQVALTR